MLNETEKKLMREEFLKMVENAKEISSEIAVAEEKLSQEFCKLEEQIGRNFTYGEITDIIADYREVWEIYIYDVVNKIRDCFDALKAENESSFGNVRF